MPENLIRYIPVQFPYAPYDCQLIYMEKVISALQNRQHALLESPTGTGKTLSLLCATLAWRQLYSVGHQIYTNNCEGDNTLREIAFKLSSNPENENFSVPPPKIIYTSRTHSQLSQVIKELKKTEYRPKITLLGSRDHLCVHSKVREIPTNTAKNSVCRKLVSNAQCPHHLEVSKAAKYLPTSSTKIIDIEELVSHAERYNACPYYLSREGFDEASVIFAPYNYLIDKQSRKAQNIDVKDAIIIFDEAHNLEGSCGDATSFEISSLDIATAILEVEGVKRILQYAALEQEELNEQLLDILKVLLSKMERHLLEIKIPKGDSITFGGSYIFDYLHDVGLNQDTIEDVVKTMEATLDVINNDSFIHNRNKSKTCLNIIYRAIKQAFSLDSALKKRGHIEEEFEKYYKVHLQEIALPPDVKKTEVKPRMLSCWCFSPGVALRELVDEGVRSVILTSGTLSPMESFAAELQLPFDQQLENPHVVDKSQILIGVVPKGPTGKTLSSAYGTRDDAGYLDDLGSSLVNFCRYVPDGLLVFFPSYFVMDSCLKFWQKKVNSNAKTVFERMANFKKVIIEPRNRKEFPTVLKSYEEALKTGGAVFLAVCRGKLSEGVDFSDAKARAVVITGIPFPPVKDPKVELKRQFLDEREKELAQIGVKGLSGNNWYSQQAARAVNQAIGRVIRHRNDFGAIFLCDERFQYSTNKSQISLWLRNYIVNFETFGKVIQSMTQFYKSQQEYFVLNSSMSQKKEFGSSTSALQSRSSSFSSFDQASSRGRMETESHYFSRTNPTPASFKPVKIFNNSSSNAISTFQKSSGSSSLLSNHTSKIKSSTLTTSSLRDCSDMSQSRSTAKSNSIQTKNLQVVKKPVAETKQSSAADLKEFIKGLKVYLKAEDFKTIRNSIFNIHAHPEEKEASILQIVQLLYKKPRFLLELESHLSANLLSDFVKVREAFCKTVEQEDWTFSVASQARKPEPKLDERFVGKRSLSLNASSIKRVKNPEEDPIEGSVHPIDIGCNNVDNLCSICLGPFKQPYKSICEHVCCKECWVKWLNTKSECPICREAVSLAHLSAQS